LQGKIQVKRDNIRPRNQNASRGELNSWKEHGETSLTQAHRVWETQVNTQRSMKLQDLHAK
jgi:hypothetical protein